MKRGLSQEQVAHAAGISVATYGKIERSLDPVASVNPRLDTITRLAAAMDIEPADFCSLLCGDTADTRRDANPATDESGSTHD